MGGGGVQKIRGTPLDVRGLNYNYEDYGLKLFFLF